MRLSPGAARGTQLEIDTRILNSRIKDREARSIDMNRPASDNPRMVFGSQGEASSAPQRRPSVNFRSQALLRGTQSSRTSLTTTSGAHIPHHLHGEFLEWLQRHEVNLQLPNEGFFTPQLSRK